MYFFHLLSFTVILTTSHCYESWKKKKHPQFTIYSHHDMIKDHQTKDHRLWRYSEVFRCFFPRVIFYSCFNSNHVLSCEVMKQSSDLRFISIKKRVGVFTFLKHAPASSICRDAVSHDRVWAEALRHSSLASTPPDPEVFTDCNHDNALTGPS